MVLPTKQFLLLLLQYRMQLTLSMRLLPLLMKLFLLPMMQF